MTLKPSYVDELFNKIQVTYLLISVENVDITGVDRIIK